MDNDDWEWMTISFISCLIRCLYQGRVRDLGRGHQPAEITGGLLHNSSMVTVGSQLGMANKVSYIYIFIYTYLKAY